MNSSPAVRLEPRGENDLLLATRLPGDPAMTEHLGAPGEDRTYKIVDAKSGEVVGSMG